MQPGDTITPAGNQPEVTAQPPVAPPEPTPVPTPLAPPPAPSDPEPPTPTEAPEPIPQEPTAYQDAPAALPELQPLSWTASEFVEHQKPQGWYLTLTVGALFVSAVLYFLLRDIVTVVVVAVAAVMFGMVGARKPRSMSYSVDQRGVRIGEKTFPYASFKSFSVIEEGAIDSIQLAPLKRLSPPLSLYFPPDQEQQIFETLAAYLPHEDRTHDPVDRLMKRLHF